MNEPLQGIVIDPQLYQYKRATDLFVDDIMADLAAELKPKTRPTDKESEPDGNDRY